MQLSGFAQSMNSKCRNRSFERLAFGVNIMENNWVCLECSIDVAGDCLNCPRCLSPKGDCSDSATKMSGDTELRLINELVHWAGDEIDKLKEWMEPIEKSTSLENVLGCDRVKQQCKAYRRLIKELKRRNEIRSIELFGTTEP